MTEPTQAETQPEVNQFVKDIFGSDDEDEGPKSTTKAAPSGGGGEDDALNDSDDDDLFANNQKGHKMKKKGKLLGRKLKKKKLTTTTTSPAAESAAHEVAPVAAAKEVVIPEISMGSPSKKKGKEKKKDKKLKKRKAEEDGKRKKSKEEKRARREDDGKPGLSSKDQDDDNVSEGDAYDSGEEVVENATDRNFLADEDDDLLAGVVNEYGADDQNFDDDLRPKKKKGSGSGVGGGGGGGPRKPLDPFSETLATMKKPKKNEVSETDKQRIATDLLKKMDAACKKDDECFRKGEPAVNKLNLLKKVEDMVSLQVMQGALLDYDILGVLSEWLAVKSDNTLPSHTVRVSVYKMLDKLPCQNEHLKRKTEGSKRTIGQAIVGLLKHKDETKENKVIIKNLVEKWSRGIFNKQTDPRNASIVNNSELQRVAHQYQDQRTLNSYATQAAKEIEEKSAFENAVRKASDNESGTAGRARAPYSSGFVYTVRPESKSLLNSRDSAVHDDSRMKVLKIVKESKRGSGAVGRKENPRAMDMAMTGRNKS